MKPSGIGGMAVMEGVMMKNKDVYAVAVRKPDNEIVVEKSTHKDFSDKVKLFKLPIFRGILAFVDSLVVGVKVLNYSASFFEEAEENQRNKEKEKKSNALLMVLAVVLSIILSIGLFMVLPTFLRDLFKYVTDNTFLLAFIEGIIRLVIFIGYVILAAMMPEIKRVFMYHGAEHKTINCLENGFELTVENVRWQSKQHKRCGTSFMLLVIIISLIFFIILPVEDLFWRVISRIILVPFIAGISYEFIRLAGKSDHIIINILSKPGLWMQGLTTREPDDAMIEVAIQSVGAVFDWREFIKTVPVKSNASVRKARESKVKIQSVSREQAVPKKDQAVTKKEATVSGKNQPVSKQEPTVSGKNQAASKQEPTVSGKNQAVSKKESAVSNKEQTILNKEKEATDRAVAGSDKVKRAQNTTQATEVLDETPSAKRQDLGRRNTSSASSIYYKPSITDKPDDEDDEILKALDKFFDIGAKENGKSGEK